MTAGLFRKIGQNKSREGDESTNHKLTEGTYHGKNRSRSLSHESPTKMNGDVVVGSPVSRGNQVRKDKREILGEVRYAKYGSLFRDDDGSETETCTSFDDNDEERTVISGVQPNGIQYNITNYLAKGWVLKKGTGMDWIRSKAWKPRWAVLCLARIAGHRVDLPILQIFWNPSMPTPSTIIRLDSAVILPMDLEDETRSSAFRFQIRHVRNSLDEDTVQTTRSFSCSRESRDSWCRTISTALLEYEKQKAYVRKSSSHSPRWWMTSNAWATGDAHPSTKTTTLRRAPHIIDHPSPTTTSTSHRSVPQDLPRHDPAVIGGCFLTACLAEGFESFLEN